MKSKDYIDLEDKYGAHNYKPLDVVLVGGRGCWVKDIEGKEYLDMLAAYGAVNQGHCHPKIHHAMIKQASDLCMTSRAFRNKELPLLCEELANVTGSKIVLPMNSGAEAIETAIKAARKWGYTIKGVPEPYAEIIVCADNFHGRTTTIVGLSTTEQYKKGFGPFTPGFVVASFGSPQALAEAMTLSTVAVLIEPMQGEGGINIPSPEYLQQVREMCDREGILLILDEIQTGLGRTGKLLAEEHSGIRSDMTCIGKALSGGFYPVSAVIDRVGVLGVFKPGDHGSTFGGNPLACAIAREALNVLVTEGMIENAEKMGAYFLEELCKINSDVIKEVRGIGLMIGVELRCEAGGARKYCEQLQELGILCKETHEHIIRFTPPLIITKDEIDWALERIRSLF